MSETCSICLESYFVNSDTHDKRKFVTKCNHVYHHDCIYRWAQQNNSCPTCRSGDLIDEFIIKPADAGLMEHDFNLIKGGSPSANAAAFRELLNGTESAYRDAVLFNSAAALLIAGSVPNLKEGVELAKQSIDNGSAKKKVTDLAKITSGK